MTEETPPLLSSIAWWTISLMNTPPVMSQHKCSRSNDTDQYTGFVMFVHVDGCVLFIASNEWVTVCPHINLVPQTQDNSPSDALKFNEREYKYSSCSFRHLCQQIIFWSELGKPLYVHKKVCLVAAVKLSSGDFINRTDKQNKQQQQHNSVS